MKVRRMARVWLGSLALGSSAFAQGPPPSPVLVAGVVVEQVGERRMVTGELRSLRVAEVASQEEGVIVELGVEVGDRVEAGQVLARIDADRLVLEKQRTQAERAAAAATVAEQRAAVVRWQSELDSLDTATSLGASNPQEQREVNYQLSQARARFARAELDLGVFDARLALLERRLRDMQIVAPFTGTVTKKLTEEGEWLAAGGSVCELLQTDVLRVVLDVPQRFLPSLAALAAAGAGQIEGGDLVIESDALTAPIDVTQVRIVPKVDVRSRTFTLVGRARNSAGGLAAGQSVIGWVPTGAVAEHTVVPTDAVFRNELGTIVYVSRPQAEGPARAMPMNVDVLFELPGRVVVSSAGLRAGDLVVVEGKERLFPTAPIIPMPAGVEDQAGAGAAPGTTAGARGGE